MPPSVQEKTTKIRACNDGLAVQAYTGDRCVLLAFDLDPAKFKLDDLAGFAIARTSPGERQPQVLPNRLDFSIGQTSDTKPDERPWTPSSEAPFQKFTWVDYPPKIAAGEYRYTVTAMRFGSRGVEPAASVDLALSLVPDAPAFRQFQLAFTRGYLSSQAYAERFHNAPIRPPKKSLEYSTAPFLSQYEWLGGHAREVLFALLEEAERDPHVTVDLFAYDLDEPDVVRALVKLRGRLRAFLDNAPLHTRKTALEVDARRDLEASAGGENVRVGHFGRFAHDKILVLKRDGRPYKVLTGSMNFSVRGLYVQANNVLVFEDAKLAKTYADVFDSVFGDMKGFVKSGLAAQWFPFGGADIPEGQVAFSPHASSDTSLAQVADAIGKAKSSVLFAVMELGGGGPVLSGLKALAGSKSIFSYGISQSLTGMRLYRPGRSEALFTSFAYLKDHVPEPFKQEWGGGPGQVIHHKFVVVDFNGASPVVFTGSSNLASGGEEENGDNLLAIRDPLVASAYAVEAIRLVDHYHFRATLKGATAAKPLTLAGRDAKPKWWERYYAKDDIKSVERELFVQ